jgi:hypothetical protein
MYSMFVKRDSACNLILPYLRLGAALQAFGTVPNI